MSINNQNIWVVGLGGIGAELCSTLHDSNNVTAFTRSKDKGPKSFKVLTCNYCNEDDLANTIADNELKSPDMVIVTSGMLHNKDNMPEKSILSVNKEWLFESIQANVLPTLNFAKILTKGVNKQHSINFITLSARIGSISDNKKGGWHSYRMSKTALNMLIKNISIEWQLKSPASKIIGYHPGTVETTLTEPFKGNIPSSQILDKSTAINKLLQNILDKIDYLEAGKVYDYSGSEVAP